MKRIIQTIFIISFILIAGCIDEKNKNVSINSDKNKSAIEWTDEGWSYLGFENHNPFIEDNRSVREYKNPDGTYGATLEGPIGYPDQNQKALDAFNKSIENNSRYIPAYGSKAIVLARMDDIWLAFDQIDRAIVSANNSTELATMLAYKGYIYEAQQIDEYRAYALYKEALAIDPHNQVALAAKKHFELYAQLVKKNTGKDIKNNSNW